MRKALVVGLNNYSGAELNFCVNDATVLGSVLEKNGDGSPNFEVEKILDEYDRSKIYKKIDRLFFGDAEVALFYFSGHGITYDDKSFLVTLDCDEHNWGIDFEYILNKCRKSKIRNKVIILDCCFSGAFGKLPYIDRDTSLIPNGVTILTASKEDEESYEINGHGVFTNLLIEAINGGASDVKGDITPGSVYSFIDSSLGAWSQRPVFKTNISEFVRIRSTIPKVDISVLRLLAEYFDTPSSLFSLDPSYEETNNEDYTHNLKKPYTNLENVFTFKNLQQLRDAGLIEPVGEQHLYYAAMNSKTCKLTAVGHHYWKLAKENKI